jgi:hypothetical protein
MFKDSHAASKFKIGPTHCISSELRVEHHQEELVSIPFYPQYGNGM